MMFRKKILYIFFPVAAIILALFLLKEHSPFGAGNTSFASDPEREITSVELSTGNGKLLLQKSRDGWLVNGRNEARKSSIAFIIRILTEMQIKSPVSPELFREEITNKGIEPVKVKVFDRNKKIRSFLVYKTGSNIYGNMMKMGESSKPFIVYVPGSEAAIGQAFTLNELFWQPYTVFRLLPSEIASVELENLSDTASSFMIRYNKRKVTLMAGNRILTGWDTAGAERYLSYFTHVPFESWALDMLPSEIVAVKGGLPLYRISVITKDGEKTELKLWDRWLTEEGGKTKDSDRLYGSTNSREELFVLRYPDIDPLLKKRSYFFPE